MISKQRAVLIHGKQGSPNDSWLPWLGEKLKDHGYKVIAPMFPPEDASKLSDWLNVLNHIDSDLTKTTFVAHARGAIALLRWINRLPSDVRINRVILVACNYDYQPNRNSNGFYDEPLNFKDLKSKCDTYIVIHSEDDKYVPLKAAVYFADKLSAKHIEYTDAGHFGAEKIAAPELLQQIFD